MPSPSRIVPTSCGCTSPTTNETTPTLLARRADQAHAGNLGETRARVGHEVRLVRVHGVEAERVEPVDRRAEPDRARRCRACPPRSAPARARTRSSRRSRCGSSSRRPATARVASSSSARPQSTPMPVGAVHLVTREGVEVAAERLHVDGEVRHALRAVDHHDRARAVRERGELGDRIHRAEHVRDVRERDHARARREPARELARRSRRRARRSARPPAARRSARRRSARARCSSGARAR